MTNLRDTVDWAPFDQIPENAVTCVCGHKYRSHVTVVTADGTRLAVARKPCGVCGGDRIKEARNDPELIRP